jgi:hypothetical protein
MVDSATVDNTRTVHPLKPVRSKIIAVGSIPSSDSDFLAWQGVHCPRLGTRDAMLLYVKDLNGQNKIRFEQEMEQWKTYMRSKLPPHQRKHLEDLMANRDALQASVTELKAVSETLGQAIVLTPQNTTQNILSLQVVPNPQNIPPPEQSSPQNHSAPPSLEQPLSLNIPPPSGEQMTDPPVAEQQYVLGSSPEIIDANKLTMQQALDLFELLQARKSKEAEKPVTS